MLTAHHLAQDIYNLATKPQHSLVVHFSYHPVLNGVGGRLHHLQVDFPQEGQADVLLVHCGFYQGTAGRTVVNDISTATMHHIDSFSVPRSEATWNEFVDMLFNTYSVVVTNLPSIKLTLAQQGAFEVNGHTWVNKPGSLSEHGLCGRVVKADNQEVLQEGLCSTLKQFGRMMLAWRARSVPETPQRAEPASDNQQQPQMMQQ